MLCDAGFMTSEKVRVVVGDDHPLFRDGVVRALTSSGSIEVVAEADDGISALEAIRTHSPQVALLDYRMPGMDGAEVAAAVLRDELPTRVLLVSAHDEPAIVFRALQEGAAGFLPKESTRSEVVSAVLRCAKGRDVLSPPEPPTRRATRACQITPATPPATATRVSPVAATPTRWRRTNLRAR